MDQDRITELINKSEITSIVNSYFRALDEKNFDAQHFASIFTPQAKVTRPNGASLIGPEEISASHEKSFTRFEGSQHFVAGHDISLDGSTANVRANLIAMHMWQGSKTDANKLDNFFIAGGVIHATLMQSDGQWRISQMSNAVLWRAGGFRDMMQTGTVTKEAQSLRCVVERRRTMSISSKLVRRPNETPMGPAQTRRQTMRVMVFGESH